MEYKGFEIVRRGRGLYWIVAMGSMIGSAVSESAAREYIDELTYLEE